MLREIDQGPITETQPYSTDFPGDRYTKCRYPDLNFRRGFTQRSSIHLGRSPADGSRLNHLVELFRDDQFWKAPVKLFLAILLPAIYGGIHLTALRYDFPTAVEGRLWVLSCCIIMSTLPFLYIFFLPIVLGCFWSYGDSCGICCHGYLIECLILEGAFLVFSFSRIFLIVESFISVRSLPIGVYSMPGWLAAFPHL